MNEPTLKDMLVALAPSILEWRQAGWTHLVFSFSGGWDQGGVDSVKLIKHPSLAFDEVTHLNEQESEQLQYSYDSELPALGDYLLDQSVGAGFGDSCPGGNGEIIVALQDNPSEHYEAGQWWCVYDRTVERVETDYHHGNLNEAYDEQTT